MISHLSGRRARFVPQPLRQPPVLWLRGPAWIDGEHVVLDCRAASHYQPLASLKDIVRALTAIQLPEDAVVFAERFGLLRESRADRLVYLSEDPVARERVSFFTTEAAELRELIQVHRAVTKAVAGDRDSADFIRAWAQRSLTGSGDDTVRMCSADSGNLPAMLLDASQWVARTLTARLRGAEPLVYDRTVAGESVPPGTLRIGLDPQDLEQCCSLAIALMFAEKEPLDICPTCERAYISEDARQKFCTPACGQRARFLMRRKKERRALTASETGRGKGV